MSDSSRPPRIPEKEWITIAGGLLRVGLTGILIIGDSGVGKSESALELISRGHLFVSDDVTRVKKEKSGGIFGSAPELSRHFMEIRGLGIINIKEIFGKDSILDKTSLDLVIQLKKWRMGMEYDRLGLEFSEEYPILDYPIPLMNIPVAPGRNIATLIEVACKVHELKIKGYHAPRDICEKLDHALANGGKPDKERT